MPSPIQILRIFADCRFRYSLMSLRSSRLRKDGLNTDGKTMQMWTTYVTGNYFEMLGARPALGRLILSSDASGGSGLVLSYSFWKSCFGGDPKVLGRKASVNGFPVTIVGVHRRISVAPCPASTLKAIYHLGWLQPLWWRKKISLPVEGMGTTQA